MDYSRLISRNLHALSEEKL